MSTTITLYKCTAENTKIDKSGALSSAKSITGEVLFDLSILNPKILIETDSDISRYNYLYIPLFHRYYFITDIIGKEANFWEISAKVDVLMSWKSEILQLAAIVKRSESLYNMYIDDGSLIANQDKKIYVLGFTNSEGYSNFQNSDGSYNDNFILTVSGT